MVHVMVHVKVHVIHIHHDLRKMLVWNDQENNAYLLQSEDRKVGEQQTSKKVLSYYLHVHTTSVQSHVSLRVSATCTICIPNRMGGRYCG